MNNIRTATTITTLGLVAMMMAGCASAAPAASLADAAAVDRAAPRLLRERHPRARARRPAGGPLRGRARRRRGHDPGLQRRTRRDRGALGRRDRRDLHRARTRRSTPSSSRAGESAHIVAGAATGGAALVVRDGIDTAADLEGTTLATPQLGNTQDVALRSWLADEGFETDTSGGGDVNITPTENAQTLTLFQQGELDGAWLPEPWVSRLILDAGAHVLVDEADLWEDGEFPTTVLLVRAEFLEQHPGRRRGPAGGPRRRGRSGSRTTPTRRRPSSTTRSRPRPASGSTTRSSRARSSTSPSRSTRTPTRSRPWWRTDSRPARRRTARSTACSTCGCSTRILADDRRGAGLGRRARRGLIMTAPAPHAPPVRIFLPGDAAGGAPVTPPLFPSFDGVMPVRPPRSPPQPAVRIDRVSKRFGDGPVVLDDITLDIAPGEFVCLLGASGCGKSTLLNLIAGLDRPTAGHIETPAAGSAVMFQESALMPWLTARRNVELALRLRGVPRAERREKALELLDTVNLADAAEKRPHELSGGMRQRVALARALAQDRPVLLMDEPFAALDAITRDLLHEELERVWRATGRTIVFVTHNVREAARLGQRVVLLTSRPGRVGGEWRIAQTTGAASSRPRSPRSRSRSPTSCGRRSAEMPHETTVGGNARADAAPALGRPAQPRGRARSTADIGGPPDEPLAANHGERPAPRHLRRAS